MRWAKKSKSVFFPPLTELQKVISQNPSINLVVLQFVVQIVQSEEPYSYRADQARQMNGANIAINGKERWIISIRVPYLRKRNEEYFVNYYFQ